MAEKYRYSGLALAVLASLYEGPMHPYRMQLLIKQRGKDEVINVGQRAGLYQTIDRLLRAGLIAVRGTARDEKRPERTIYELTEVGRETLLEWMRELLSTPKREYPRFPAALAYLPLLSPEDVRSLLDQRAEALEAEIERIDVGLADARAIKLLRLFIVEDEYIRAMLETELSWVRSLVDDLAEGRLTWNQDWLHTGPEQSPKE
jgi:DNA-binding PadR family transcriptional regulator